MELDTAATACTKKYPQTSSRTLVGNEIVDHSDVVGASPGCRRWSNYISILDLASGFSGLGNDNYKTRRGIWHVLY